jgi:hypothetical protein
MKQHNFKKQITSFAFVGLLGLNLGFPKIIDRETKIDATFAGSPRPSGIKNFIEKEIKTGVDKLKGKRGTFKGQVTAIKSTSLTVDNNGSSVQVNIDDKTQFRRRFWGKGTLSEISVGDTLDIAGKWTNETKSEITAVLIRNESIQKRFGVFFGEVKSLTANGFVMTTIHRDDETVTLGTAKLVNRKEELVTASDIKVGDRVRVRGMWNSNLKTITETTEIKDFSLP